MKSTTQLSPTHMHRNRTFNLKSEQAKCPTCHHQEATKSLAGRPTSHVPRRRSRLLSFATKLACPWPLAQPLWSKRFWLDSHNFGAPRRAKHQRVLAPTADAADRDDMAASGHGKGRVVVVVVVAADLEAVCSSIRCTLLRTPYSVQYVCPSVHLSVCLSILY